MDRGQCRRCLNVVEIYNPDGDFWREGAPLPWPILSLRSNASNAGVVDGKIYVCGYYKGAGNFAFPHTTCELTQFTLMLLQMRRLNVKGQLSHSSTGIPLTMHSTVHFLHTKNCHTLDQESYKLCRWFRLHDS